MNSTIRPAVVLFAGLTVICGVLYPYAMTGVGKLAFADKAEGSIVVRNGQPVGSTLIGQGILVTAVFLGQTVGYRPDAE